jgi:hypothetical protein
MWRPGGFECRIAMMWETQIWEKQLYKVVQIWPGLVRLVYTQISSGHIWTTLYFGKCRRGHFSHIPYMYVCVYIYIYICMESKGEIKSSYNLPWGHKCGLEVELYSFFNLGAREVEWWRLPRDHFTPGKETWCLFNTRLIGQLGRSGRVQIIPPPPTFDLRTVHVYRVR